MLLIESRSWGARVLLCRVWIDLHSTHPQDACTPGNNHSELSKTRTSSAVTFLYNPQSQIGAWAIRWVLALLGCTLLHSIRNVLSCNEQLASRCCLPATEIWIIAKSGNLPSADPPHLEISEMFKLVHVHINTLPHVLQRFAGGA